MNTVMTFAVSVAATVSATFINRLLDRPEVKASMKQMVAKAPTKGKRRLPIWLRFALNLFAFWFLIDQLVDLAMSKAPITRMDMVMTAFWMCWLIALYVQVVLRREE